MAGPPSTAHPSTLTSPPDPDHHAVPDPRHANFHHLRDTTRTVGDIGNRQWAIAEGYIPGDSSFEDPAPMSHEAACILNPGDRDANVAITLFFTDREPVGPYRVVVPARRTRHLRFNDIDDPEPVPRDTPYSSVIESDVPIVVQHSRLDSRKAEVSLLSTVAYSQG
jgi:hypothetical protein